MNRRLPVLIASSLLSASVAAHAACPPRLGVLYGDTLSSIAAACGIGVEALRRVNPGLTDETLRAGRSLAIPRPVLPSPQAGIGRTIVRVAPPAVRSPSVGGRPEVVVPPLELPVPQQHILRGFGDKPGQLPLPPGHAAPGF